MHKYLPSKRFAFILLSVILALGIIWGFSFLKNYKTTSQGLAGLEAQKKVQEFMALDSDNDGLPDWEEALYHTDPKNPDTDGDGTNDGDEVKANRDPLKANTAPKGQEPNDKINPEVIAAEKKTVDDFNKLSETDKVSRMLFSQYLATKKVGQTFSTSDLTSVINNTLTVMPAPSFKQYAMQDLKLFEVTNTAQIKEYGNEMVRALSYSSQGQGVNFNEIIDSLAEDDSPAQIETKLAKLQPLIAADEKIVLELLKIKVPVREAASHLALLNALEQVSDNLLQITQSADDPIKLINLIYAYPKSVENLKVAGSSFSVL